MGVGVIGMDSQSVSLADHQPPRTKTSQGGNIDVLA